MGYISKQATAILYIGYIAAGQRGGLHKMDVQHMEAPKARFKKARGSCGANGAWSVTHIRSLDTQIHKWCMRNLVHQDVELQEAIRKDDGTTPTRQSTSTPGTPAPTKRRRQENTPREDATSTPAKAPDPLPDVSAAANCLRVVNRPEAAFRCYEARAVPRTATADAIKKDMRAERQWH